MNRSDSWSESALFHAYWDDGLLDLLAGLALLLIGLGWQSRLGILAILQAPLWTMLWFPLRQRIVEPRAGYVAFCQARQQRSTKSTMLTAAVGLVALGLVLLGLKVLMDRGTAAGVMEWVAGLPALIIAVMCVMAAILTSAQRFYLYTVLSLAAAVTAAAFSWHPGASLAAIGAVVAASGAWLLARFLRDSRGFVDPG